MKNRNLQQKFIQSSRVFAAFPSCDIKSESVNVQVFQTHSNYYVSLNLKYLCNFASCATP